MPRSSRPNHENPFFHTETVWKIELDDRGDALHYLEIKVLNPEFLQPITTLSIDLPPSGVYTDFVTEVGDHVLLPGTGYIESAKRYTLSLSQLLGNAASVIVKVSFKHQLAATKVDGMSLVSWPVTLRLQGPINIEVFLPPIRGYKRVLTALQRMADRKPPYYIVHELDSSPLPLRARNVDIENGQIRYLVNSGIAVTPSFAFVGYSGLSWPTIMVGLLAILLLICIYVSFDHIR